MYTYGHTHYRNLMGKSVGSEGLLPGFGFWPQFLHLQNEGNVIVLKRFLWEVKALIHGNYF